MPAAGSGTRVMVRSSPGLPVAAAGLAAGVFDIAYACLFWHIKAGTPPRRIMQSVASGLLGPASFQGGIPTAALGLLLHFLIALAMAGVYYVAARRWMPLWRRPLACGAVYGLALYVVMNYVVIPLSAAAPASRDPLWVTLTVAVHALLIGIPCALGARRALATEA